MRSTPRTARKFRRCEGCLGPIEIGDRYLEHVAAPGAADLGNTRWWRLPECGDCARRHGRPITTTLTSTGGVTLTCERCGERFRMAGPMHVCPPLPDEESDRG